MNPDRITTLACLLLWTVAISAQSPERSDRREELAPGREPTVDAGPPELIELRTLCSKTYAESDGRRRADIRVAPIHFRSADGSWQDVDPAVLPIPGGTVDAAGRLFCPDGSGKWSRWGYANESNGLRTYFDPFSARVRAEGERTGVQFRPVRIASEVAGGNELLTEGRLSPALVHGSTVTYAEAFAGVDVIYEVGSYRISQQFVLHQRPLPQLGGASGQQSLTIEEEILLSSEAQILDAAGVPVATPQATSTALQIRVPGAAERIVVGQPWAWDAGGARVRGQLSVQAGSGGGLRIATHIPLSWLNSPEREYPVTVDPDLILQPDAAPGKDCGMSSSSATTNFGTYDWLVWGSGSGTYVNGAIAFDLAGVPPGSLVRGASLNLYYTSGTGTLQPVGVYRILSSWDELTLTWATSPLWVGTPEDVQGGIVGGLTLFSWDVTSTTRAIVDGVLTNDGWLVHSVTASSAAFRSSDYASATVHPFLHVYYDVIEVKIREVNAADSVVFPGQGGYPVWVAVENVGGRLVTVDNLSLTFTGTADRSAEYTVTPSPLNPQAIAGRRTEIFNFTVAVSPTATQELILVDADLSATDPQTMITFQDPGADINDVWIVSGPLGPTCALVGPAGSTTGNVAVTITPQSMAAATVDAVFEYSLDLGATWASCTPAVGSPLGNPAAGVPVGVPSSFVWDTVADGVGLGALEPQVLVRATVDDQVSASPGTCVTGSFGVDNSPPAPTCTLSGPTGTVAGDIPLTLQASSGLALTVTTVFGYSTDMGITWLLCTAAPGSPISNPAVGVPTSSPIDFLWDSVADGVGVLLPSASVLVRAVVDDLVSVVQGTCTTGSFSVDNVPPIPTCTLVSPMGVVSGDILVGVTPDSMSAATADVLLEFTLDLGMTFSPCTMAPTSLVTNPALGVPVTAPVGFLWDSFGDGVGVIAPEAQVFLRATVTDGVSAVPGVCVSSIFGIDNVPPVPTCSLTGPVGIVMGDLSLTLDSASASSATVTATFEFSVNGGVTWLTCTAAAGSPLANPAIGTPTGMQSFLWDTQADGVGLAGLSPTVVRATIDDGVSAVNGVCNDGPLSIDNTGVVPSCTLTGPAGTELRDVSMTFTAMSTQVAIVDVSFDFSLDGGVTWTPCARDPASPLQNPAIAVAVGAPMSFVWDSLSDGVALTTPEPIVVVRALVDDRRVPVLGFCTTATFAVDNSGPPCGLCGDCDENGTFVTIIDSLVGAQIAAGTVSPTLIQGCVCDIDSSGTITVLDSLVMAQSAAGLPVSLTCPGGGGGGGTPPTITLLPPPASVDPVGCPFDVTGVPTVDLSFHYSTNGGASWNLASPHPSSPLLNPHLGVPAGMGFVFVWHSAADLPNPSRPVSADLRITAIDPASGASAQETRTGIVLNPSAVAAGSGTCADPYIVAPGVTMPGTTVGGGEDSFPNCGVFSTAEDVTYSLTFTGTRDVTIDCLLPSYAAAIYVQTICGDNMSEIACNDGVPSPQIFLPALAGGTYYIWVDGVGSTEGTFDLLVTVN